MLVAFNKIYLKPLIFFHYLATYMENVGYPIFLTVNFFNVRYLGPQVSGVNLTSTLLNKYDVSSSVLNCRSYLIRIFVHFILLLHNY